MAAAKAYDLILYGATGFTGRLVASYVSRRAAAGLRWAVAGRSAEKLESLVASLPEGQQTPSVVVVKDAAAAPALADQTRVVLSTAGPFSLHSDALVAACAQLGTSYVDINGEIPWVRKVIDRDHGAAVDSGAIIVPNAGFDSVPSDLAVYLATRPRRKHGRPYWADIEGHVTMRGTMSGGTIATGILMSETYGEKVLGDPFLLGGAPASSSSSQFVEYHDDDVIDVSALDHSDPTAAVAPRINRAYWLAPFGMARINTRVVRRSAALRGEEIRYREFAVADSKDAAAKMARNALVAPEKLRSLVEAGRLPKPSEGPDESTRAASSFELTVVDAETQAVLTSVAGGDPGYDETAKMVAEAALALVERPRHTLACAGKGGVWTPSTAFGDVLVEGLREAGLKIADDAAELADAIAASEAGPLELPSGGDGDSAQKMSR